MADIRFVKVPTDAESKHFVAINIEDIASYGTHTVVSYSYQEWTRVVLKGGKEFDCFISGADFEKALAKAGGTA